VRKAVLSDADGGVRTLTVSSCQTYKCYFSCL